MISPNTAAKQRWVKYLQRYLQKNGFVCPLTVDVKVLVSLCRTSWIPYQYFVKAEGPMNHESIEERQEIAEAEYRAPNVMRRK